MKPSHLDRLMIGIDRRLVDRPIPTTGRAHVEVANFSLMTDWLSPRLRTNYNRMVVEGRAQLEAAGIATAGKTSEQILMMVEEFKRRQARVTKAEKQTSTRLARPK